MIKALVVVTVAFAFAHPCLSQIGETKEELSNLYGAALAPSPPGSWRASDLIDDFCWFRHNNLRISAYFKAGKAVKLQFIKSVEFTKRGKGPMSDDEISSILGTAVENPNWVLISDDTSTRRWRTGDSSTFAYYFTGHGRRSQWWGPDYAIWVQTATVDAVYQATEEERRARLEKRSNSH